MTLLKGLPLGTYACIAADCPWRFATWSENNQTRAAANHYRLMSIEDLCALPVQHLAAEDSLLFLWAINTMIPQALQVMEAWGFRYSTMVFTWAKTTRNAQGTFAPKY